MTIEDFVVQIWRGLSPLFQNSRGLSPLSPQNLLHYGHITGWLEDQDEAHPKAQIDRRTVARIIHQFMKLELHIKDNPDISSAEMLKDLYTCRVCANHVAQVYVKGLMDCEEVTDPSSGATVQIFNMLAPFSEEETERLVKAIQCEVLNLHN